MPGYLISYPHPVINNNDDYPSAIFTCDGDREFVADKIRVNLRFAVTNTAIEALISTKAAQYGFTIECPAVFYRETILASNADDWYEFPAARFIRNVSIKPYIISTKNTSGFLPIGAHSDYGKRTFDFAPGDLLAIATPLLFSAEKEYSLARPKMSSLMVFSADDSVTPGTIALEYIGRGDGPHAGKLIVKFPKEMLNDYRKLSNDKTAIQILHSAVFFPVLAQAIQMHKVPDYEAEKWAFRLGEILSQAGVSPDDPFAAAQKILKSPLGRGINGISVLLDDEEAGHE